MSDVEEEKEEIPTQNNPIFESKYSINSSHNHLLEQFEKDKNGIVSTDKHFDTELYDNDSKILGDETQCNSFADYLYDQIKTLIYDK